MIPNPPDAVRLLAQRLLGTLVPSMSTSYAMSDGSMLAMLLIGLGPEMESGIARRLIDIAEMKAILGDDEPLQALEPASMALTDIMKVHDALTTALIGLHAAVDVRQPTPEQAACNAKIWKYLDAHAQRHKLNLP